MKMNRLWVCNRCLIPVTHSCTCACCIAYSLRKRTINQEERLQKIKIIAKKGICVNKCETERQNNIFKIVKEKTSQNEPLLDELQDQTEFYIQKIRWKP